MGWKGTLRSMRAAARRAERAAERRHRELLRQQKATAHQLEIVRAAEEVEAFENHLAWLSTLHRSCSQPIDWQSLSRTPEPLGPLHSDLGERAARTELNSYQPGWWDRLLNRQEQKTAALEEAIEQAAIEDRRAFEAAQSRWQEEHRNWKASTRLAKRVLEGMPEAQHEVLKNRREIAGIDGLGSSAYFGIDDRGIHASLQVNDTDIVPRHSKTQLKSGKLSVKELPKRRFHDLYQDHVCSCVLRLARELFALLPITEVLITAKDRAIDPATGHLADRPILSSYVPRATLRTLNLQGIDPSESMRNFLCRMDFKTTRGFTAIEPMSWPDIKASA